ncbi:MAG: hypothetical protein ACYC35_25135 [Pirellulales bacterium]
MARCPGERRRGSSAARRRAGASSVDYVLILGIVLPLVTFIMWIGPRMIRLVYEMTCVLISWPFM